MSQSLPFFKYQGTGNDFVMLDQRKQKYLSKTDTEQIRQLCDRRFGIGADGLILLEEPEPGRIVMVYFNADGSESTMCGNGGRCFAAFAHHLGIAQDALQFEAIDGPHLAIIRAVNQHTCQVDLQMIDVPQVQALSSSDFVLNTGSPHYICFTQKPLTRYPVVKRGRAIRNAEPYKSQNGINVNFVQSQKDGLRMRTYERGVEDETLSCGTGVTAAALAAHNKAQKGSGDFIQKVQVEGGHLEVRFRYAPDRGYSDIWLCGPAVRVFMGEVIL